MKKVFWNLSIVIVLFFSLYASRHFLIASALEFGIGRTSGNSLAYQDRYWEGGRLVYREFALGEQLNAKEAAFDITFHLFPFSICVDLHFTSPTIHLDDSASQTNLAFLIPTKFWTVKLNMEKGILLSQEKKLCLFDFSSGVEKQNIGKLSVYQEDGAPLFTCGFVFQGNLAVAFQMEEAPLEKTLPILSLFYPSMTWKNLEGTASAILKGNLDADRVNLLQGFFSFQNVRVESETLVASAESAKSQIDFQGKAETFALDTDFKGVDLFWKELEVHGGEGSIVFKPNETPTFEVHAAVHVGELEGRADVVGKGQVHDNRSLWLEGILDYVTAHHPLRMEFSWADDGKAQVFQTQIYNLGKEFLGLLNPQLPWKIQEGRLDGQVTAFLDEGIFDRLQLENVNVHQLTLDTVTIEESQLHGSINLLSGDIENFQIQAHDIHGEIKGWKLSSAEATIALQDNIFQPSSAFGKLEGVPFALEWQGPLSSFHASARLSAGASEWMKLPKNSQDPAVILDLTCDRQNQEMQIRGALTCLEDTVALQAQANLDSETLKGTFQSARLQSSFYLPFLKIFSPALSLQGDVSLRGQFSEKGMDVLAQGDNLLMTSPAFQLSLLGQSREVFYHWDLETKQGNGKGKLSPIVLKSPRLAENMTFTEGDFVFDHASFACTGLKAYMKEIDIQGDLSAHWQEKLEVNFLSQNVQGSIEDLTKATAPFYQVPLSLKGRFTTLPEAVQIHYEEGRFNYRCHAELSDIEGALTPKLNFQKASCNLAVDSLEDQLILQNVVGKLPDNLTFSAQEIRSQAGHWAFDGALQQGDLFLLSLQGNALETTQGYQITLNEAKTRACYLKTPLTFHWTLPEKIEQVRGVIYVDAKDLLQQLQLADRLGLWTFSGKVKETLEQLQGSMTLRLAVDDDRSEYEIEGSQIRYASTLFNTVKAHLIQQGHEWRLKQCVLDDIQIRGQAALQNAKWIVSACNIDWKDLKITTAGIYDNDRFDFKIDGECTPRFSIQGNGIFFSAIPQLQNLSLKILDQKDLFASIHCDKIAYQKGKWESPAVELTLLLKECTPLHAKLQTSLSPSSVSFQGPISQGEFKIGKGALQITEIYGLYEAPYLNLKGSAALDQDKFQFLAKLSKEHRFGGGINIQRGKEVLKLLLSDPATCQKAEGDLLGLNVQLQREAQGFKGTVLLKDGAKLAALMGHENLKDFSGLKFTGLFTAETFKGQCEGRDARIKEYLVQEIQGNVDYTPQRFLLKNLSFQDPAGSLQIKECHGFRNRTSDPWNITIPLIKGQEIKPSAVRKTGTPPKEIKPLQIRHFVMTDVLGQLGDLRSFRGIGKFNFTQHVKKEPSLFDIPLALLKDFGLDFAMFSPVMGEAQVQLKEGKLFFTGLQNAFSEGKRSEFYLAKEPSYIDLNGGLFLNLRMQQNVVLKLVEPFMIAVRGTWEKPKYSLQ